jgi:hypothetical protein
VLDHRGDLAAENARLQTDVDRLRGRSAWVPHHPYERGVARGAEGPSDAVAVGDADRALVERIIAAYGRSEAVDYYGDGSWWQLERHRLADIHDALTREDVSAVTTILREPLKSALFFGYEHFADESSVVDPTTWRQDHVDRCLDQLVRLAETFAVLPTENPEGGPWDRNMHLAPGDIARRVEKALGMTLAIRTPHQGIHGIPLAGGVLTERMIHAVYGAWRVAALTTSIPSPGVLEIGAGVGYTAYYAAQLGVSDYTIVDLPMTNVAQAYFLGRTLGPDRVVLEGEEPGTRAAEVVKIRTPAATKSGVSYDIVVNIDSLTEFGAVDAGEYADRITEIAPIFLSINHEANDYTVHELFSARGARIDRAPYWLRRGYVEEVMRPAIWPPAHRSADQ